MPHSTSAEIGETVRISISFDDTSILPNITAAYAYKSNTETGSGKLAERASVRKSSTSSAIYYTIEIKNLQESDAGYYYLVIDTTDGRKQTNKRIYLEVLN